MRQPDTPLHESFQPIAIRPPSENRLLFFVRCIVDLQMQTIFRFLRDALPGRRGRLLDVGAGQSPWRFLLGDVQYVGLDIEDAAQFGMTRNPDIVYYDGGRMPFPDDSFNHALCVEVVEHVSDPQALFAELLRVLKPGGSLVLTVPWSARLHHLPHDYRRLTRYGLSALLNGAGFTDVQISERGNDIAVMANKLIVLTIRLLRPQRRSQLLWTWPLALVAGPIAAGFLAAAHLSMRLRLGSLEDPLGYGVVALKAA